MKKTSFAIFFCLTLVSQKLSATIILQYHHISTNTPKATSISPELFEKHLNYLQENQFKVIPIEDFLLSLENNEKLPEKSVVITFDDGYDSIINNALPLLKAKNYPFTVFVNAKPIKDAIPQFMGWKDLQRLIKNGATIANHSFSHSHLIRRLDGESKADWLKRVTKEVLDNQNELDKNLSKTIDAFAYPYGEYDFELKSHLKRMNIIAFGQQSGAVSINVDKQAIPRFPFGGIYGRMEDFALKVNSLALPIIGVQLLDESNNQLVDHVLSTSVNKPKLKIELSDESINVSCFYSSQGLLKKTVVGKTFTVSVEQNLPPGRSRFNCTAPTKKPNQFYWYSQSWIKTNLDGSWYQE